MEDSRIGEEEATPLDALVYRSTARRPFGVDELHDLAVQSGRDNAALSITGYLTYRHDRFTQYLEGPPSELAELFARIERDLRHNVEVKVDLEIQARRFPRWYMELLDPLWHPMSNALDAIDELLHGFSPTLDADVVPQALAELVDQVRIDG